MLRTTLLYMVALLAIALGLTITIESQRLNAARAHAAGIALHAANVAALADSSRDVAQDNAALSRVLGDSLRVSERKALQVAQQRDALDVALRGERVARYAVSATLDTLLRTTSATSVTRSDSAREATFQLRETPYSVQAHVFMPSPPDSALLSLRIIADPIPLDVRVRCEASDGESAPSAIVDVATPRWARASIGGVSQTADVCARTAATKPAELKRRRLISPAIGIGRVFPAHCASMWGAFVGLVLTGA